MNGLNRTDTLTRCVPIQLDCRLRELSRSLNSLSGYLKIIADKCEVSSSLFSYLNSNIKRNKEIYSHDNNLDN